ncbi:hypothetical protein CesoFtcFv8_022668 [Champsocephalus esox]|uniref:Uncharacterized protein n=1 Tax=Champsocephalus esox TaxID=159716 RepID=A0AAN8B6T0_9TELE|nr:hypothetical protein CesoFtcFv8_022668 [Champsocephalus esox]
MAVGVFAAAGWSRLGHWSTGGAGWGVCTCGVAAEECLWIHVREELRVARPPYPPLSRQMATGERGRRKDGVRRFCAVVTPEARGWTGHGVLPVGAVGGARSGCRGGGRAGLAFGGWF